MTSEEKYELFEKWCNKEVSDEEKAILDNLIKEDKSVKEAFELYQEMNTHLAQRFDKDNGILEFTESLQEIGNDFFDKKEPIEVSRRKVIQLPKWSYAVAASVVLLIGFLFFNQSKPVYADYAHIPELFLTVRGEGNDLIKKAEEAFNGGEFDLAEDYLSQLLLQDPQNAELQYYYGISLVALDKYLKASVVLNKIASGNSIYKYKAIWFEALNQLKQQQFKQTIKQLKKLPKQAEDYLEAQKLLKRLE